MPISEKEQATAELSPVSNPEARAQKNGRWSGYWHLVVARLKELRREPEVIFWVFVFPLLLALGLGIAFRNKPADASPVVIVEGPGAQHTLDLPQQAPRRGGERAGGHAAAVATPGCGVGVDARPGSRSAGFPCGQIRPGHPTRWQWRSAIPLR